MTPRRFIDEKPPESPIKVAQMWLSIIAVCLTIVGCAFGIVLQIGGAREQLTTLSGDVKTIVKQQQADHDTLTTTVSEVKTIKERLGVVLPEPPQPAHRLAPKHYQSEDWPSLNDHR